MSHAEITGFRLAPNPGKRLTLRLNDNAMVTADQNNVYSTVAPLMLEPGDTLTVTEEDQEETDGRSQP